MNEVDRIIALCEAGPVIRMLRDGGTSFEDIARKFKKRANPLGLSPRQLSRIYEGPDAYSFDKLRRIARELPDKRARRQA